MPRPLRAPLLALVLLAAPLTLAGAPSDQAGHPTGLARVSDGTGEWSDPRFYASWMYDEDYLAALARDPNPDLQARKLVVAHMEAALARVLVEGRVKQDLDQIMVRYIAEDYKQHDPNIPEGRAGLAAWFRAGGMHKGDIHPMPPVPIALIGDGDLVSLVLKFAPVPPDPTSSYSVSAFRVTDGRISEHFATATRGAYWCRIGCGKKTRR